MIGHDQPRALLLSLSDGSRISFESKDREIDLTGAEEKLTERYGASGIEVFKNAFSVRLIIQCERVLALLIYA